MTTITCANHITTEKLSFSLWIPELTLLYNETQEVTFPDFPTPLHNPLLPCPLLPFHSFSYLLHNCLLKVLVNKRPFPPSLKRLVVYPVKGVGLKWRKVHFTQDTKSPLQSLWLRMGTFQCFTGYWASKSVPFPRDQRSQMVHQYRCSTPVSVT